MNSKHFLAVGLTVTALVSYGLTRLTCAIARQQKWERRCLEEAVCQFEGEGGLVLS